MNIGIIIQARRSSTRFHDKILQRIPMNGGDTILSHVVKRCMQACDNVIVATTTEAQDDLIEEKALKYGAKVYRGSLDDVMARYIGAIEKYKLDIVVRITSDCPLISPEIISGCIDLLHESNVDYVSNVSERVFPHGLDVEVFKASALIKSNKLENDLKIREHVTMHMRNSDEFTKANYITDGRYEYANIRITVDTEADYTAILALHSLMNGNTTWQNIVKTYELNTWLKRINSHVYQKQVFLNIDEEIKEAKHLLKLHGMLNACEMLNR